jgi:hypothetical protein
MSFQAAKLHMALVKELQGSNGEDFANGRSMQKIPRRPLGTRNVHFGVASRQVQWSEEAVCHARLSAAW